MKHLNQNKMKILVVLLFSTLLCAGTPQFTISPMFKAVNFWMPGENENGLPDLDQDYNGDFQKYITQLKSLGVTHVRIGGKAYDQGNMWSPGDLEKIIVWLRSNGFEVIVQVPVDPTKSLAVNSATCAYYVDQMNVVRNLHVELWEIGNEPDTYTATATFTAQHGDYTTDGMIAAYTRSCSAAMKAVSNQQYIKIIGPSLNAYHPSSFQAFLASPTASTFIGGLSSAGYTYVDYISFNQYPFDYAKYTGGNAVTRQQVIDYLRSSGRMAEDLDDLEDLITASGVKSARSNAPFGIMITEANIGWQQNNTDANTKGINGLGPGSFIGGQFWAETMAIGMEKGIASLMHGSVVEGTNSSTNTAQHWLTDIGLIGKEATGTNTANPVLRPAYHHFKMMNAHFTGIFFPASSITPSTNIKAWAAKSGDRIAVMVQNQNDGSGGLPCKVRLNNTSIAGPGSGTVDIAFSSVATGTYAFYNTSTLTVSNESSVLLLFDCVGNFVRRYDYTIADASSSPDPGFHAVESGTTLLIGESVTFSPYNPSTPFGETVTVTMSQPTYTYNWSGPGGSPVATIGNGSTVTLVACDENVPCVYSYTVTDDKGCFTTSEISVTDGIIVGGGGSVDWPYLDYAMPSVCGANNGSARVYCGDMCWQANYKLDGGPTFTSNTSVTLSGLSPGTHTIQLMPTNTYSTSTFTWQFYIPITGTRPAIFAGFDRDEAQYCYVPLEATPAYTNNSFQWYVGNSTVPFRTGRATGVTHYLGEKYRVKYTDPVTGCTNEDEVFVNRNWDKVKCLPTSFSLGIPCDQEYNSTSRSQSGIATETLSISTKISNNMYFDKILTVPSGVTLTIEDCVVAFSPSAHIVVQNGGGLIMESTFFVPCGTMFHPYVYVGGENVWLNVRNSGIEGGVKGFQIQGTNGCVFENNVFARTGLGIDMDNSNDFGMTENLFYDCRTPVRLAGTMGGMYGGTIDNNHFMLADTAIYVKNGNYTQLAVRCNTLEYNEYGIVSQATLSSFGSSSESPGNVFVSSTPNHNHQLKHDGNTITYYMSPQNSFNLTQAGGLDAFAGTASSEPVCPGINTRVRATYNESRGKSSEIVLQAYPNPTNGIMTFVCVLPAEENGAILSIYELGSGKRLLSQPVQADRPDFSIDLSSYSAGVMLGVLETSKGEKRYIKIIKAE